jgi:hypothetical protein
LATEENKNEEKEGEAQKEEIKEEPKNEEPKEEEVKEEVKEEIKEEIKEVDVKDNKLCFEIDGEKFCFGKEEICKKIKEFNEKNNENEINIPVILYLNNMIIVTLDKDEIKLTKKTEEDEEYIPEHVFNFTLIDYFKKKLNIKKPSQAKDKKITISLFSLNRDLSALFEEPKSLLNTPQVPKEEEKKFINFVKKIGFYLKDQIEGYKVEYKLYDLCEQSLVYHLFNQEQIPKNPVLLLQFDKMVINSAICKDGVISIADDKFILSNINKDGKELANFVEKVKENFKGIDLVLSSIDDDEDNKKIIEEIKKSCNADVVVYVYSQKELASKVFNYINLFYDN